MNPNRRSHKKTDRLPPWPLRWMTILLTGLQLLTPVSPQLWAAAAASLNSSPASAVDPLQDQSQPSPGPVVVNRTVPQVSPPSGVPIFSADPSDAEISRAQVFADPIAPTGRTSVEENRQLALALTAFVRRAESEDFGPLTRFLDEHSDSPWRASLLTGLGALYRRAGWFTKALACWQEAWALLKDQTQGTLKTTADVALAELVELDARLGRSDELDRLFTEVDGRDINPALSEKIHGARQGLWLMQNRPGEAFRCGPMALSQIWRSRLSPEVFETKIFHSRSTPQGFSLSKLCDLANELGMDYQMARRQPGSAFVAPAVVNWKVGHYAAVICQAGSSFLVQDPTFGDELWMSQAALEEECSGYFLLPAGKLPDGWEPVSVQEGSTIWGKGTTQTSDPSKTRPDDDKTCNGQNPPGFAGMAAYAVHLMLVSLNIVDTPVGYAPPRGPAAFFKVTYNQRDAGQPATFQYSNLGFKWTFDWLSYITDDGGTSSNPVKCYLPGGGYETYTTFNTNSSTYCMPWTPTAILG